MELEKYSLGIGDRFGYEGSAQLEALKKARALGVDVVPVWNKSNREHTIIGTSPEDTRKEADEAVRQSKWPLSFYVDADHIGLGNVDKFLTSSNFFTIDVADYIGREPSPESVSDFIKAMERFKGILTIPGVQRPFEVSNRLLAEFAKNYLCAVEEAGKVYRYVAGKKGQGTFVTEISTDEAQNPQTPTELFFLLAAISHEKIPLNTIAPKFSGAFLKGVDYVGDVSQFSREFEDDLAVIAFAIKTFNFPRSLKLSVHSGSDKFSLYPVIHKALKRSSAGLHLKTAGTTWLEEVIGMAEYGKDGLSLAKELYSQAVKRYEELCKPYLSVIEIVKEKLPSPKEVASWSAREYVEALRHDQACPAYDRNFRQLIHVSFRIAAEMGTRYTDLLKEARAAIEANVAENLFERHIQPLFLGKSEARKKREVVDDTGTMARA